MQTAHGFDPRYNAQAAADESSQLIVATELGQQATDVQQLVLMVQAVQRNVSGLPDRALADTGYASEANCAALEAIGTPGACPWPGATARCRLAIRTRTRPLLAWRNA